MKRDVIRNPDDMRLLRNRAKKIGEATKFSASEVSKVFDNMDIAGWKTEDALGGIGGVMKLAAVFGEDLGTVVDIVTHDVGKAISEKIPGEIKIISIESRGGNYGDVNEKVFKK